MDRKPNQTPEINDQKEKRKPKEIPSLKPEVLLRFLQTVSILLSLWSGAKGIDNQTKVNELLKALSTTKGTRIAMTDYDHALDDFQDIVQYSRVPLLDRTSVSGFSQEEIDAVLIRLNDQLSQLSLDAELKLRENIGLLAPDEEVLETQSILYEKSKIVLSELFPLVEELKQHTEINQILMKNGLGEQIDPDSFWGEITVAEYLEHVSHSFMQAEINYTFSSVIPLRDKFIELNNQDISEEQLEQSVLEIERLMYDLTRYETDLARNITYLEQVLVFVQEHTLDQALQARTEQVITLLLGITGVIATLYIQFSSLRGSLEKRKRQSKNQQASVDPQEAVHTQHDLEDKTINTDDDNSQVSTFADLLQKK